MANKAAGRNSQTVYSATYSNVPVYEFNVSGNHVMRRRSDDWINATHILKVADYDKPARTRILEREVQKGVHEKVQGGYGKYQGTWIPLPDGRELAAKNGVLDKLMPIFTFVPGDRSPPPAPKHETAASSKPRASRQPAQPRKAAPAADTYHHVQGYEQLDVREGETPDNETVASESHFDDYDYTRDTGSRKRRRVEDQVSQADRKHQLWAEELLDYFMLGTMDAPIGTMDAMPIAPQPPANANLNRPIDEKGHTALHWAAAMGDVEVVKDLIRRGASIDCQSKNGETPLMRSAIFTNCFDKRNMEKLASLLIRTVNMQEWSGSTVFHHIAGVTQSKKKYECARYYMDCILNKMTEVLSPADVERVLNEHDRSGDTAVTIAARNGARKCVRSLIGRNAAVDVMNNQGETADQLIVQLNHRRQERNRQLSSSPFQAETSHLHHPAAVGGAVQPPLNGIPFDPLVPRSSLPPTTSTPTNNGVPIPSSTSTSNLNSSHLPKSEAALTLTSSILPTLLAKAQTLATAFDAEIEERDAEVAEAERVVALRRAEMEGMRRVREELRVREMEQTAGGTDSDEELTRVLGALVRECEGLTEEEEGFALADLLKVEEGKVGSSPTGRGPSASADQDIDIEMSDSSPHETTLRHHLHLARQLAALHAQRRQLIGTIVRNISLAGYGREAGYGGGSGSEQTQEQYKRLITGALNVREEDVEGMLAEIVAELEEWRGMEGVGG